MQDRLTTRLERADKARRDKERFDAFLRKVPTGQEWIYREVREIQKCKKALRDYKRLYRASVIYVTPPEYARQWIETPQSRFYKEEMERLHTILSEKRGSIVNAIFEGFRFPGMAKLHKKTNRKPPTSLANAETVVDTLLNNYADYGPVNLTQAAESEWFEITFRFRLPTPLQAKLYEALRQGVKLKVIPGNKYIE
jgi:hypothetical protein